MGLIDRWRLNRGKVAQTKGRVVNFAGGMGAQILSAAIYFDLQDRGEAVSADLSYFDRPRKPAIEGQAGSYTHWEWQLDFFNMPTSSFISELEPSRDKSRLIPDGVEKLALAFDALDKPAVQARFKIPADLNDLLPAGFLGPFLCMHVRRGDYVNVASHLISDAEFIDSAMRFTGLVSNIVILSDSELPPHFKAALDPCFGQVLVLTGIDAFASHRIMRGARVLICSNSQFSLIAALLNRQAMALLPKQWYSGDARKIEAPIHLRCVFQLMAQDAPSARKP
jgi:Glycosyl transferase family 11